MRREEKRRGEERRKDERRGEREWKQGKVGKHRMKLIVIQSNADASKEEV